MPITPKIKAFVEKLQGLPESKKKIVLWTTMAVVGLILGVIFFNIISKRLKSINQEEMFQPFNSLIDQTKLPDESLDKINEIKNNISDIKNSELIKQLEEEVRKEQNSNAIK